MGEAPVGFADGPIDRNDFVRFDIHDGLDSEQRNVDARQGLFGDAIDRDAGD